MHKFCHHCQTISHDDSECWSTRVIPAPQPSPLFNFASLKTPDALLNAIAKATRHPPQDKTHDPEFTL